MGRALVHAALRIRWYASRTSYRSLVIAMGSSRKSSIHAKFLPAEWASAESTSLTRTVTIVWHSTVGIAITGF